MTPSSYAWDLDGDGQYNDSTEVAPSYTYTSSGSFVASLRVTDRQSASATAAVTISVGNTAPAATITRAGDGHDLARGRCDHVRRRRD